MSFLQAIILGIVQGLTEFIPISSTAHLVFVSRWTNLYNGNAEQITATMAVIQLGTLAAVFVYFASDIVSIVSAFIRDHWALVTRKRGMRYSGTHGVRPIWLSEEAWLGWLIIIGSIPIGIVGFVYKDFIEGEGTKNLWFIATMLIAIAIMLALAELLGSQRKRMRNLGLGDAIAVGLAQVLALMPGASRSGSTIMGGLFAGQTRETAARFSFLLSIPAITASGLLQLREAWAILPQDSFMPLFVATVVSAVVGYVAIWFLIAFLRKRSTAIFIVYRLILGSVILVLLWQGFLTPQI
ncbi:MAG: undecaprenyl-diphosphatase UppP [Pyrinomonadaceae bacterium]|nr:undecaprenyl-diphosphatase UppP [Blastocatellia bacterium]MDQ3219311.1 undecaprenyl-diphosphatase UppP [Acidobacteriota bacterium]MDQ3490732.1 undecaprenyl-diphosphatase UppP [Acidobacteriota bacterium]